MNEKIIPQMTVSEIDAERERMSLPWAEYGEYALRCAKGTLCIYAAAQTGEEGKSRSAISFVHRAVNDHHDLLTRVADLEGENAGLNELHGKVFREKVAATATIEHLRAELATLKQSATYAEIKRLYAELSTVRAVQPEAVKTMRPLTETNRDMEIGDCLKTPNGTTYERLNDSHDGRKRVMACPADGTLCTVHFYYFPSEHKYVHIANGSPLEVSE